MPNPDSNLPKEIPAKVTTNSTMNQLTLWKNCKVYLLYLICLINLTGWSILISFTSRLYKVMIVLIQIMCFRVSLTMEISSACKRWNHLRITLWRKYRAMRKMRFMYIILRIRFRHLCQARWMWHKAAVNRKWYRFKQKKSLLIVHFWKHITHQTATLPASSRIQTHVMTTPITQPPRNTTTSH